jgi:hypothetical protein
MKRVIFLVMAALLAMLILVPMAVAQDTTIMEGTVGSPPPTGGLNPTTSIVLPAAVLLLGSGILSYAILRRR